MINCFSISKKIDFTSLFGLLDYKDLYIQGESKKVWFVAPGAKLYLFCATLLIGVFSKFVNFFGTSMAQKKSANFFFLKIKSSEKQKCVNKLFRSKSKILKRKELENLVNFFLKKRPELKIANFLFTIFRIFCDSLFHYW